MILKHKLDNFQHKMKFLKISHQKHIRGQKKFCDALYEGTKQSK